MRECKHCGLQGALDLFVTSKDSKDGRRNCCWVCQSLWGKYRMRRPDFDRMLTRQGGGCAICGRTDTWRRMSVDHDHVTGAVRGILCDTCNKGIGMFGDDTERVRKALTYLSSHD